jgi:CheY-like chemotaxis protein
MRDYSIKHRILLLSSLPVVAASLILILASVPTMGFVQLVFTICLILLLLSLALYFSVHRFTTMLREYYRDTEGQVSIADQSLQETPESGKILETEFDQKGETKVKSGPEVLPDIYLELRIPLNSIIGFTNLLLHTGLSGKQAEYLDTIRSSSETLLKLVNEILDNSKPGTGSSAGNYERLKVLVVDDNQMNLRLVCTLLEDLGTRVEAAHDGEEAVRFALENHFDLILMDIQMPGMNGIEAMNRIHNNEENGQKTPIVALTAHSLPDEVMQLLDAGMDDYVVKPVSEKQLKAKMDKWVKQEESIRPTVETPDRLIVDPDLCLRLANNSQDLAEELLAILKDSLPDDKLAINNAFSANDTVLLRQLVHRLNGAVKYCGVPGLHDAVEHFDIALKAPESAQSKSELEILNREIDLYIDWCSTSGNHMH